MSVFCATREPLTMRAANGTYRQWAKGHVVTWGVAASPAGMAVAEFRDIARSCFAAWSAVSGLKHEYRSNPNAVNVRVDMQRIDGPSSVLAQAELPGFGQTGGTLGCWLDSGERKWILSASPDWNAGEVDVFRVLCHEFGHNLGLGHAPQDGSPADLMDPRVSDIRLPQDDWDVPQIRFRHGRQATPDKPEQPTGKTCWELIVDALKSCQSTESDARLVADVVDAWRRTA